MPLQGAQKSPASALGQRFTIYAALEEMGSKQPLTMRCTKACYTGPNGPLQMQLLLMPKTLASAHLFSEGAAQLASTAIHVLRSLSLPN